MCFVADLDVAKIYAAKRILLHIGYCHSLRVQQYQLYKVYIAFISLHVDLGIVLCKGNRIACFQQCAIIYFCVGAISVFAQYFRAAVLGAA